MPQPVQLVGGLATGLPATGDSWMGRHSNIPRCCIRFYVERWTRWIKSGNKRSLRNYNRRMKRRGWNGSYIPCPKCLIAKRVVKIHHCGLRCGLNVNRLERPLWDGWHDWRRRQRRIERNQC